LAKGFRISKNKSRLTYATSLYLKKRHRIIIYIIKVRDRYYHLSQTFLNTFLLPLKLVRASKKFSKSFINKKLSLLEVAKY